MREPGAAHGRDARRRPRRRSPRTPSASASPAAAWCTRARSACPAAPDRPTVLLAGDSHAGHWRAAVEVVAQARGWHAVSLTHSGCPFTANPTPRRRRATPACKRWFVGRAGRGSPSTRGADGHHVVAHAPGHAGAPCGLPPHLGRTAAVGDACLRDPRHAGDQSAAGGLREPRDRPPRAGWLPARSLARRISRRIPMPRRAREPARAA